MRPWTQNMRERQYPPEEDSFSGPEDFDLAEYRRRKEQQRRGAAEMRRRILDAVDPWSVTPGGAA